ncbi:hypothetical protein BV394_04845 [Brevirhabdus pacifica]|uniref:Uncharacterized protein n=2 Tax=Brevirhabdus pacifica TaxID=1267768 RepID=A0A1U7DGR1_9RHOB|nr:geranylgeranyl reductase family protein [Brevirhabdus pacifica]APX89125.1 hypothetical protein BV394_04845 [Brevirhabdus pacifica]OWU76815.1 hypothetical protein ATO5_11445 [Loktanella sp. 22II-4b]PJJ86284.1 geranylgeranyl reductase family protein [Brevirhabdus pacifica]
MAGETAPQDARPFDVVVVGGGPAGSAAARRAAALGLRTALIDRADFPRDKLCGGLVTGRSRTALARIFDLRVEAEPTLFLPSRTIRFMAGGTTLRRMDDAPAMWLTMRRAFDARLVELARQAGAEVLTNAAVTEVRPDDRAIVLRDGRCLRYRVLIGADGVNSTVARALFGRAFDPATIGFGLEAELSLPAGTAPETLPTQEVVLDLDAADWGYGWIFPKAHGVTLGVGGLHAHNPDMRDRMLAQLSLRDPAGDPAARTIKGAYLPFGDFRKLPGRGCVLLAGDAAGLVDPITGEGIAHALDSGSLAAEAAAAALSGTRPDPDRALVLYRRSLRPLQSELRQSRFWRRMIFSRAMRPVFKASIARGSSMPARFLALLAGELDYGDLRRDLILRTPRSLLRAVMARGR